MTLSKEDLIEIRTLLSMNCKPQKIYEFRVENEFRGARDWKRLEKIVEKNGRQIQQYFNKI